LSEERDEQVYADLSNESEDEKNNEFIYPEPPSVNNKS